MRTTYIIAYCSPAGTTRHAANVLSDGLQRHGNQALLVDVSQPEQAAAGHAAAAAAKRCCICTGTPVYAFHAVPPLMAWIDALPALIDGYAAVFATWGGVTSGTALHEMATALAGKGARLLAAAKVLAVHSLLWQQAQPLADGHPDATDDAVMDDLARVVCERLQQPAPQTLPLETLVYQPGEAIEQMRAMTIAKVAAMLPVRRVDESLCTQCGICRDLCPADAIRLTPYPIFTDACISCYMCMRNCPEQAISADFDAFATGLRQRAAASPEDAAPHLFS